MTLFPLTTRFRATTFRRAFVLNAVVTAAIAAIAISLRKSIDLNAQAGNNLPPNLGEGPKTMIVLAATSLAALIVYQFMYMLVGYGGGQLVNGPYNPKEY